ncbi:insulinase family protein [Paucibacter sp. R3-3]|uniref:Insulinase family protein n=1 Tax=Roseateles agri TaxID=3098619 RepID=A0ABU5DF66_9BURK|nr:insulinase family protein [Paucibacter sp. R3-3]MDY0744921.1 insulinase family protein [Paucibacter sp. R3-3]
MKSLRALLLACLLTLIFGVTPAQPQGLREVRSLGGITEYALDANGLQVLLMPVSGAPRLTVTVTYRVGSRQETAAEAGMAHLLEHLSFHDAEGVDGDISAALQALGARYNGTTSFDRTNYLASLPADAGALALRRVLQLEAARMSGAHLSEQALARETPIVLNELGLRGQALAPQMQQALSAAAFRQHPYGRPVIGYATGLEQLSLPALRAFYARHYRPDRAVLMIAGGFDTTQALAAVTEVFGALPRPAAQPPEEAGEPSPEPDQTVPRVTTLRTRSTALAVGWRVPGMAHRHAPALAMLSQVLASAGGPESQALAGVAATRDPYLIGRTLPLPAVPSGTASDRAALEMREQRWIDGLQDLRIDRSNAGWLRSATAEYARQWQAALRDPERASSLISDAIGAGDWRLVFKQLEGLQRLQPDDIAEVARLYLRSENRSVARGVTDPAVTATQFEEQPLGFLSGLFSKPVQVQRVDDPSQAAGQLNEPAPAPLAGGQAFETDAAALDRATQRYQLPSGMRIALLPRETAGERVALLLQLRWGAPREMAKWQGWRALAPLLDEGTAQHTADQVREIRMKLGAEIHMQAGPQGLSIRVAASRATLVPTLVLLREMLAEPLLPEPAFRRLQAAQLSRLPAANARVDTGPDERERRFHMIHVGLNRGEPGYQPSAAELAAIWRELRVEDVREFHRRFCSANDAIAAVVGALPDKLPGVLEELIGRWKKPGAPAFEHYVQHHFDEHAERFVSQAPADAPAGSVATVVLHQEFALNRDDPDFYPLLAGVRVLAGGAGEPGGSRLADRLRSREAISYAIQQTLQVPAEGDRAFLRLQAGSAPRDAGRLEAGMREEIARLLADGVGSEELEAARGRLATELRQPLLSDAGLAASLMGQLERGSSFSADRQKQDQGMAALTAERVDAALRRLLRPEGWVAVVRDTAGD